MRLTLHWNSALESIDRRQDLFREHWDHSLVFQDSIKRLEGLIMYSYSKCLPHPSRWIAGLSVWKLLSFGNSWEKFKIFLPFFLRYFDWNHAFYYVNKFSILKMNFLSNIDTYLSQSLISRIVICNTLVENWDHIIFPSLSILFLTHNE